MAFAIIIAIILAFVFFFGPIFWVLIDDTVDLWKSILEDLMDRRNKR